MNKFFFIHVNLRNTRGHINLLQTFPGYPPGDLSARHLLDAIRAMGIPSWSCKLIDESRLTPAPTGSYGHRIDDNGHLHLYYDPDKDWDLSLELEIHKQKLLEKI